MLSDIGNCFNILASCGPATAQQIEDLEFYFGRIPPEYRELIEEATELELEHESGQYIRIWSPDGCIDMDKGYEIGARIPGAFPIGDDGGGRVIFYQNGNQGPGLYHVGYGNLDGEDATWLADGLRTLLTKGTGIDTL